MRSGVAAALLFLVLAPLLSSCASSTSITTYPKPCELTIDDLSYGRTPLQFELAPRPVGDYQLVLRDRQGKEVFRDVLPLHVFAPAAEYEIDTSVQSSIQGKPPSRPSEERETPPRPSAVLEVNSWVDQGFALLDRGWLSEARRLFELANERDGNCPDALLGLALYFRQKGDEESSQVWLRRYRVHERG